MTVLCQNLFSNNETVQPDSINYSSGPSHTSLKVTYTSCTLLSNLTKK